jgi:hypothetical protein
MINFHLFFQNTNKSSLEEVGGKENALIEELILDLEALFFFKEILW